MRDNVKPEIGEPEKKIRQQFTGKIYENIYMHVETCVFFIVFNLTESKDFFAVSFDEV